MRADLREMLETWRVLPDEIELLHALYCATLNRGVAQRCTDAVAAAHDRGLHDRLDIARARARESTWTSPELAYAYYVALDEAQPETMAPERIVAALEDVTSREPPPTQVWDGTTTPDWASHALRVFNGDLERDGGTPPRLQLTESAEDWEQLLEARSILCDACPEVVSVLDRFTREVLWFANWPGTATLAQAFGAMFLGSGRRLVGRIEDIVHEASHLELIARMALDKLIVNGSVSAKSPFRSRPRPLPRVLHAGFTAQRVLYALEPCVDLMTGKERDEVAWHITHSRQSALTAIRSLEQSAQWTEVGDRFFSSMRQDLAAPAAA